MIFIVWLLAAADVPVHCVYEDLLGDWQVWMDLDTFEVQLDDRRTYCDRSIPGKVVNYSKSSRFEFEKYSKEVIRFSLPNKAYSGRFGEGTWTLVYDEGFILTFEERVFNTYFFYYKNGDDYKSVCTRTTKGWHRGPDPRDHKSWGCFYAEKILLGGLASEMQVAERENVGGARISKSFLELGMNVKHSVQFPITAGIVEPPKKKRKLADPSYLSQTDYKSLIYYWSTPLSQIDGESLPPSWDWSDISGTSFISSTVRQQHSCGSCYAITTCEMLESRLRILTNHSFTQPLSVQYLISCSFYTEGCSGGYPTLLHKFIQEFGIVSEDCMAYTGNESKCSIEDCAKPKVFVQDYYYVGAFYGASNEVNIMKELRARGPVIIDLDPGASFLYYKGGILKETSNDPAGEFEGMSLRDKMKDWERVTHSVLLVGWGEERGEKYWKCLNSWGDDWGEAGFFRIRRGTDEDCIESMAEAAVPFIVD